MSFSPLFADTKSPNDVDLATLSNYLDVRVLHTHLDWTIDWDAKTFGGSATLSLEGTSDAAVETVVLDTSYLDVKEVTVKGDKAVRRSSSLPPCVPLTDGRTGLEAR